MVRHRPEAYLLLLFGFRHYCYQFWPQAQWGYVYGMAAACCLLALLAPMRVWLPLKAWVMGEELLSAGCYSLALSLPEWFKHAFADEKCSQVVGFKIGSIGLLIVALLAFRLLHTAQVVSVLDDKASGK